MDPSGTARLVDLSFKAMQTSIIIVFITNIKENIKKFIVNYTTLIYLCLEKKE